MPGRIVMPTIREEGNRASLPMGFVRGLLDTMEKPLIVAERSGRLLLVNTRGRQFLESNGHTTIPGLNLFNDLLKVAARKVFSEIEKGEHEVELQIQRGDGKSTARVQWMPESDWLVLEIENGSEAQPSPDPAMQLTVQELLQEREITYRNLLAAYLKLQEVNRQKTVFLASAAHELKTPLAVIKGYYDLLLAGSLGRLTDKQRDILEESKDSCERLVRLVSMFLNYSALESGKLVLQLPRPNSVEVSVADSGPGIAAEHQQEIFEDFVRVDRNTSGMGLGLAIAKRLIQAHRGKIWVASESQTGSKFTFLLPMDQG